MSGAITLIGLMLVAACGGEKGAAGGAAGDSNGKEQAAGADGASACSQADTTPIGLAVRDYITKAQPTPQRFLSAVGTDSAVPEDGFKVLQDKGPTYFYSSDSVAQRKIREKLASAGPYASLLVVYRGETATDGGRAIDIRLGGHYVGGAQEGQRGKSTRYAIRCDSTGWAIASSAEEQGT